MEAYTPGMVGGDPKSLLQAFNSLLCPAGVAVLAEDIAQYLLNCIREDIQDRRDGWVDDDIAFTRPWGFEPGQIRIPVMHMHGEQDQFVPFSHGNWLANKIVNVEARFLAEDGHLTLSARRVPEVHAWLLSKMQ